MDSTRRANTATSERLSLSHRQYKFNVDIRLKTNRRLFTSSNKVIHELEWLTGQGTPIVLLEIRGLEAIREASFYFYFTCHPHIVRTFGSVKNDTGTESMWLLQEYAPVGDLSELLREHGFRPSENVFIEIFIQICDAMICLADNGIVHGDLGCRNVLVFRSNAMEPKENLVKLTDFGSARGSTIYSVDDQIARSKHIEVPVRYAAPEILQTMDATNYSERSDIFSMGALMWEALSFGVIPYASEESDETVRDLKRRNVKLPEVNCSPQLWRILQACWHRKPVDRPDFRALKQWLLLIQLRSQGKKESKVTGMSTRHTTTAPNLSDQNRMRSCSFCGETLTSEEISTHLMTCGNKTELCPNCHRYVRRAVFVYHQDNYCTDPEESFQRSRRPNPEVLNPGRVPAAVTTDDNAFLGRRATTHFASMREKPKTSQQTVECQYCRGSYARTEYENHQKTCFAKSLRSTQQSDRQSLSTESSPAINVDRRNASVQTPHHLSSRTPHGRPTLQNIPESTDSLE